jgi:hypothetical protein
MNKKAAAPVLDFKLGALRRTVATSQIAAEPTGIFADVADGIEAMHQLANCAGFSERARSFIFALASAAYSEGAAEVKLYDEELAELQDCSDRTVQRQRADYKKDAARARCWPVEIEEGDFNRDENKNEPTVYRFAHASVVEQIVTLARSAEGFDTATRRRQRETIKRVAAERYRSLPDARGKARKRKRDRLATAEIETCQKVIKTKLASLKDKAAKLPPQTLARLLSPDESGDLLKWWLEVRAEMDAFFGLDSAQPVERAEDDRPPRQLVVTPPTPATDADDATEPVAASNDLNTVTTGPTEPDAAAVAVWERLTEKMREPQVRSAFVPLNLSEPLAAAATGPPREVFDL